MPYRYPDLNAARALADAGAACIMPLGAPIGSNKGLCTKDFIQILVDEIDIKDLRDFQFMGHSKIEFKPLPPQFNLENVSKKRNHALLDDLRQNSQ